MAERPRDIDERAWQEALDWIFEIDRKQEDPATAAALHAWLAKNDAHARAYEQARLIWELSPRVSAASTGTWPRMGAPEAALARSAAHTAPHTKTPARRFGGRLLLAGVGALAASLLLFVLGNLPTEFWADYATRVGEAKTVALDDSTHIHLNTDSAIQVAYGPAAREVELLRGEAFFDVARDERRPFIVTVGTTRIEVRGTQFDVRLDASRLSVSVAKGQVAVSTGRHGALRSGVLAAGESVRIDLATDLVQRGRIHPGQIAAWRDGRLIVERWTVAQVLDEIGRHHRGYVLLHADDLGDKRVSGVYDLTRPADAVRAVVHAYGGRVIEISPYLLIVSGH